MKQVTTYTEGGRTFIICKAQGEGNADGFWAFEDKFVDTDGRLTKQFNGISGHHSSELAVTLERVSQSIRVDKLVAMGMPREQAAFRVCLGEA